MMGEIKSKNYLLLLNKSHEIGVERENILEFLWLLNFPHNLLAIKEISENLSFILRLIERKLPHVFKSYSMEN